MSKNTGIKKDITLMTLLANESTSDARKLLKKYGKPDPKSYSELEVKLAELYFETPDKVQLEKELAELHPHKNWLTKLLPPKVEIKEEIKTTNIKSMEDKSSVDGENPNYPYRCRCRCCSQTPYNMMNNFDGDNSNTTNNSNNTKDYIGLIGVISVIGLTFYFLSKNTK